MWISITITCWHCECTFQPNQTSATDFDLLSQHLKIGRGEIVSSIHAALNLTKKGIIQQLDGDCLDKKQKNFLFAFFQVIFGSGHMTFFLKLCFWIIDSIKPKMCRMNALF